MRLFATVHSPLTRDERFASSMPRGRESMASDVHFEAPMPSTNDAHTPPRLLSQLDAPLMTRILRLETTSHTRRTPAVMLVRDLRELLLRACRSAPSAPVARIAQGLNDSFDGCAHDAVRLAYAWSFAALDALLAETTTIPRLQPVESSLVSAIEACEIRRAVDGEVASLAEALVALLHALRGFARFVVAALHAHQRSDVTRGAGWIEVDPTAHRDE